jgi:hypothetical protein
MDRAGGGSGGDDVPVFRGRIEESDFVNIRRCLWRLAVRRSIRWLAGGLLTFIAVAGAIGLGLGWYLGTNPPLAVWLAGGFWIGFWAYVVFITPVTRDRHSRRWYRRHESEFQEAKVAFGADRIVIESDRVNADYAWALVKRIVDAPEGLLFLNIDGVLLIWLPDRLFAGDAARSRLFALAEAADVPVRRLL